MSAYTPPTYVVSIYNPAYFTTSTSGITIGQANALYLQKTTADTATALETFSSGIATGTIQSTTSTADLNIYPSQTGGNIYLGVNSTSTTGRTGTIHIGDGNSMPSGATIHINNGTSNASNTNIMNGATTSGTCNILTGATTSGTVNIATGTGATQTSTVNIGSGTTTGAIAIGNTSNTTSLWNTTTNLSYSSYPTYTTSQIGYTSSVYLSTSGGNALTTSGGQFSPLSFSSIPIGLWAVSYATRVTATSTTATTTVTSYQTWININNQTGSVPYAYGSSGIGVPSLTVGTYTTGIASSIATNGCAIINIKVACTISLTYIALASASISFWNDGTSPINPSTYLTITRIG